MDWMRRLCLTSLLFGSFACRPKAPAEPPIVDVSLGDFFFHAPDTIPSGRVSFRLNAVGDDGHVMDLIRLEQGKTMKDLLAGGEETFDSSWVVPVGGGVSGKPGESPVVTMSIKPGRYVLLCYFSDDQHVPHFMKGMFKEVIAVPSAVTAAFPKADLVIETVDYGYHYSTPITAGERTIAVVNPTKQAHEMIIQRLKPGFTIEQARARADSVAPKGPSPWERFGGVGDLAPGDTIVMRHHFTPGIYSIYCFFGVKGDSVNHYGHGMHEILTVD